MRPFCFVHIEKAGGITLHNTLHWNYPGYISPSPAERFGEFFTASDLGRVMRLWWPRISGIGGHRMASTQGYDLMFGTDVLYFTFVRDPIARFLSHFDWQRRVKGIDWTLEEFARTQFFQDFQCYRIAGQRDFVAARDEINRRFGFVGTLEDYDRSMLMLAKLLGRTFNPLYVRSNKAPERDGRSRWKDLTANQQALITDANAQDMQLYNHVREILVPRYSEAFAVSAADLSEYRSALSGFCLPRRAQWKRKITNRVLADIVQPLVTPRSRAMPSARDLATRQHTH